MTTLNELLERYRQLHPDDLYDESMALLDEAERVSRDITDKIARFIETHVNTPANVRIVKTIQARRERLQAEFDQLITKSDELIEAWKNVNDEDYARAEAKRACHKKRQQ